jgi:hypothetical protein
MASDRLSVFLEVVGGVIVFQEYEPDGRNMWMTIRIDRGD